MKTALKVILIAILMFGIVSVCARAEDGESAEHLISYDGAEYTLESYDGNISYEIMRSDSAQEIIDYISGWNDREIKQVFFTE